MKRSILVSIALLLVFAAGGVRAHGNVQCPESPKDQWKPHTELERKLVSEGWRLRRMAVSNSCYEVYGVDPQGKRVEAFFDPKTLMRVEEK